MSTGNVFVLFLLILLLSGLYLWLIRYYKTPVCAYGRRKQVPEAGCNNFPCHPPKPEWVKEEVIRLKALMPRDGYRKIAYAFNRLHGRKRHMTVGKTYVGYIIRAHQYEIQVLRKEMKHKPPRPVPQHLIWAWI